VAENTNSSVWQIVPRPFNQSILLRFDGNEDTGRIRATLITEKGGGAGGTVHIAPDGFDIGAKRWHHAALTFDSRARTLQSYLDSKCFSKAPTNQSYDYTVAVKRITAFRLDIAHNGKRVLNGSISLIRMYGKQLNADEIRENFRNPHDP